MKNEAKGFEMVYFYRQETVVIGCLDVQIRQLLKKVTKLKSLTKLHKKAKTKV